MLANLPRTRPQRSSPRRAAARKAAGKAAGNAASEPRSQSVKATAKTAPKPRRQSTRKQAAAPGRRPSSAQVEHEQVPRQGFETQGDGTSGSVQPPGGVELVASAVEIVGELARASLSSGERVLRDVFSRLPRP